MTSPSDHNKGTAGYQRVKAAIGHSFAGFRHAFQHETAIREELLALVVLVPISALLPVTDMEHLVLVLSMMLVILVEFVNSAIESTIDRISLDRHPLSGRAKDLASSAVLIAVLMSGLSWLVIAGPLVARWVRR